MLEFLPSKISMYHGILNFCRFFTININKKRKNEFNFTKLYQFKILL